MPYLYYTGLVAQLSQLQATSSLFDLLCASQTGTLLRWGSPQTPHSGAFPVLRVINKSFDVTWQPAKTARLLLASNKHWPRSFSDIQHSKCLGPCAWGLLHGGTTMVDICMRTPAASCWVRNTQEAATSSLGNHRWSWRLGPPNNIQMRDGPNNTQKQLGSSPLKGAAVIMTHDHAGATMLLDSVEQSLTQPLPSGMQRLKRQAGMAGGRLSH